MKLDLTTVKKNPLFNRQEVEFKVEQVVTPTRSAVKIDLAVALRVELNQVYVREIKTGQVIGKITGLDNSVIKEVISPVDGVVHEMLPRRLVYQRTLFS